MDQAPTSRTRLALLLLGSFGAMPLAGCATHHVQYNSPVIPIPDTFKSRASLAGGLAAPATARAPVAGSIVTERSGTGLGKDAKAGQPDTARRDASGPASAEDGGQAKTDSAPAMTLDAAQLREWWHLLGDQTLNQLVDRALANNPDLHVASERIEQGWTRTAQAHANRLPVIGVTYQAITQKPNAASVGTINTPSSSYHDLQLSLSLSTDPWGERSATEESASMQMWRLNYIREDTRRTLVANTVSLYVDYLSLNDRLRIAHDTRDVLNQMLESVHGRMEAGDATMIDYEQQRAAVHAVAATIPVLELQRDNAANGLAALLGVPPSALALPEDRGLKSLHFPDVMPGVPTQLLLNRPDIHAAEMRLHAAQADIDVARAKLLPTLDLTAQTGYGAQYLSKLVNPSAFYWNAIASVSATLFDHGAREEDVAFAQSVDEELVESYVQTIYGAIKDTEDALATIRLNTRRLNDQDIAAEASGNAWHCSTDAYAAGAIDYLTLLETQRSYFNNMDTLQTVLHDRSKGMISLFAALGGGTTLPSQVNPPPGKPAGKAGVTTDSAKDEAASPTLARLGVADTLPDPHDWLVSISGLQDEDGVNRVASDLGYRFADVMQNRKVMAKEFGSLDDAQGARVAWYRVFIAGFGSKDQAGQFCATLSAQMQRCQVLPGSDPIIHSGRLRTASVTAKVE